MQKKGYIYIVLTTIFFSSMEVALKMVAGEFNPIQLNMMRFLAGGLFLLPFTLRNLKARNVKLAKSDWLYFCYLGFLGMTVSLTFYQLSITRIQASVVAAILSGNPLFVALFAWIILHEMIAGYQILGLVFDIVGIVIIINPGHVNMDALGLAYICIATVLFALYGVAGKKITPRTGGMAVTCFSFLIGAAQLIILSAISHIPAVAGLLRGAGLGILAEIPFFSGFTAANFPVFLYIAIGVSGMGFGSYFMAMEYTSASETSLVYFFKPVLAAVISVILLHETIAVNTMLGIGCIILGSLVSILPKIIKEKKKAAA